MSNLKVAISRPRMHLLEWEPVLCAVCYWSQAGHDFLVLLSLQQQEMQNFL